MTYTSEPTPEDYPPEPQPPSQIKKLLVECLEMLGYPDQAVPYSIVIANALTALALLELRKARVQDRLMKKFMPAMESMFERAAEMNEPAADEPLPPGFIVCPLCYGVGGCWACNHKGRVYAPALTPPNLSDGG